MHQAGAISAADIPGMLGDGADEGRADTLKRSVASLRRRFAVTQEMIAPQPQRDPDPVEAATRRAHQAFAQATRAKLAEAEARPRSRPPFAGGGAADPVPGAAAFVAASDGSWPVTFDTLGREITR